jgi:hypothetical protein
MKTAFSDQLSAVSFGTPPTERIAGFTIASLRGGRQAGSDYPSAIFLRLNLPQSTA